MSVSGVYCITNKLDGKIYVGSATHIPKRLYEHRRTLGKGTHKNSHLQNAWRKYGEDAFMVSVLEYVGDKNNLIRVEQHYIDLLGASDHSRGYNIHSVADRPAGRVATDEAKRKNGLSKRGNKYRLGKSHSEEVRRKISLALAGRKASPETKAKLSAMRKGAKRSPEWRANMSAAQKGRAVAPEMRERISATLKGRKLTEEHKRSISNGLKSLKRNKHALKMSVYENQSDKPSKGENHA